MSEEKITLEVSERELLIITEGVSATMQLLSKTLEKHRNHKDYSMDKLFMIMEMYANTGDLWLKLHKAQGISQEEIAQYLLEQEK
jgi:pyrroloquinoline quinone (PQQ) biosynthesis protein C